MDQRRSPHAGGRWGAATEASVAVLELTASEQPQNLDFVAHVLCNSTMSFAVEKLAAAFEIPLEKIGQTVGQASQDLDHLEKHRGAWREPAQVVANPNLPALRYVCRTRIDRVSQIAARRRRLERIQRRIEAAYQLARSRAWIEAFIGPLPAKPQAEQTEAR